MHHHTLPLPALLPGVSHHVIVNGIDDMNTAVVEELRTAGYSVSR
jgi:hypothetical protein